MKNKFNSILVVLATIAITACSSIPVSQDFEQGFDYSGLKTFAWLPNNNNEWGLTDNELVDRRIRNAITDGLVKNSLPRWKQLQPTSSSVITWLSTRESLAAISVAV